MDDIMYRVFGELAEGECDESDSCGNNSDTDDQSSEEEMDIDNIHT